MVTAPAAPSDALVHAINQQGAQLIKQGAEAVVFCFRVVVRLTTLKKVYIAQLYTSTNEELLPTENVILKHRFPKSYRHPTLDRQLTKQRLAAEAKALVRAAKSGIAVPCVKCVDFEGGILAIELIHGQTVREFIGTSADGQDEPAGNETNGNVHFENGTIQNFDFTEIQENLVLEMVGQQLAKLHTANIIHGDLTTSNMMLRRGANDQLEIVLIDFGLSFVSTLLEDKAVDLYVLERAFLSTHPDTNNPLLSNRFGVLLEAYSKQLGDVAWLPLKRRFDEVRLRGRKRDMTG